MEIKIKNLTKQAQELKVSTTMKSGNAFESIIVEANSITIINASQITPYLRESIDAGIFAIVNDGGSIVEQPKVEKKEEIVEPTVPDEEPHKPTEELENPQEDVIPSQDEQPQGDKNGDSKEGKEDEDNSDDELKCKECGAEFSSRTALKRHISSAHK